MRFPATLQPLDAVMLEHRHDRHATLNGLKIDPFRHLALRPPGPASAVARAYAPQAVPCSSNEWLRSSPRESPPPALAPAAGSFRHLEKSAPPVSGVSTLG